MVSILRYAPRQALQPMQTLLRRANIRAFTSGPSLRLKEDKHQDGHELEQAKQDQHHKDDARRELASASEERVHADKQDVKDHDKHMDDLQKQTAQKSEEEHPEGKA